MTHDSRRPFAFLLLLLMLVPLPGCDNIGRAFDPDVDPGDPGTGAGESAVQVVPEGGDVKSGRPRVRATYPEGGGWPATVPIVVEFSESVNEATILPTSAAGTDARIVLRVQGAPQPLPCAYDFLAQGRLLVMRPVTALSNAQTPVYEVVLLPDARDCDGVRFDVPTEGTVLAEFQVNQDASFVDGRILATYPRDNVGDVVREADVVVVFDRPATAATVVDANLQVQRNGGAPLDGELKLPLNTLGVPDGRVAQFRPENALAAAARFELIVTADIRFGTDGELDFRGRTPFSRFETVAPPAPTAVTLANAAVGYPEKVNLGNVADPSLRVTTPTDALAGDVVRVRIYGGDKTTTPTGDLKFFERTATLPQDGVQTIDVSFAGALGTAGSPKVDDGDLTFTAQLQRGSQMSSFIHQGAAAEPMFDVTAPTVQRAGPPGTSDGRDLWCDTEHVAFYGVASERLGEATLDDGIQPTVNLLAANDAGRFVMAPVLLGRLSAPRGYQLTVKDSAGNSASTAITGNIVQRGVCTGTLVDTLVVEAYDQATLQPIVGATILVDPGVPVVPAVGQQTATSDGAGRASFSVTAQPHTITIVRAGYDLITLYTVQAAFVSLPLRPSTGATANFTGNIAFQAGAGVTAIVGNTAFDDRGLLGVRSTNAAPGTIPVTPIQPNRPQIVTGFAGVLEPTANPPFSALGTNLLGASTTTLSPPGAPAAAGAESRSNLVLGPSTGQVSTVTITDDMSLATGFDLANLASGGLRVRMTASLVGYEGQALLGIGFLASTAGNAYTFDASYGISLLAGLASFQPNLWSVVEGADTGGRFIRTRQLIATALGNLPINGPGPLPIPAITAPTGPFAGSPQVTFVDGVDPASAPAALATVDVVATDPSDRRWTLIVADRDVVGGTDSVQFPDLATANVQGLVNGNWSVVVAARLWFSGTVGGADDFVLSDRVRNEVEYSRSAPVTFVVQ